MMVAQLVLNEGLAKPFSLLSASVVGLAKRAIGKEDWRPNFKYSEEIVWIIYFQTIMLISTMSFPPFVILQPVLIYIIFQAYYFHLTKSAKKPVSETNKENMGIVIMIFVCSSLIVWIGLMAQFFSQKLKHSPWQSDESRNCGPLENEKYG